MKGIMGIGHVAYNVSNMKASLEFYVGKLGFTHSFSIPRDDGTPWIEYLHVAPGQFIELFYSDEAPAGGYYNHLCLQVEDCAAAVEALRENGVVIDEPFRADGLHRILYQCPHCGAENEMEGKGTALTCHHCGKSWELGVYGDLSAEDGETEFSHIPDWYAWERKQVREELGNGSYSLETDVSIGVLADYKALYLVGDGHLSHSADGFVLDGCDGALHYEQKPLASYSLYSDYFWYERSDVICIGNGDRLYYCFPKENVPVAKTRMAAEELYKLKRRRRKAKE